MELLAAIVGLESLKKDGMPVVIYSDSKYVVDSVEKGWLRSWVQKNFKGKANVDLWVRFLKVYKRHQVKFIWVKGHASNIENNRCDELAVAAYKLPKLHIDFGYEQSKNTGLLEG